MRPRSHPAFRRDGPGPLSRPSKGRKKAAVLLVSLGPEKAAEVFRHLREEEIESLSLEMAKLQRVDHNVSATVMEELAPFSGKRRTTGMKKGMKESYIKT